MEEIIIATNNPGKLKEIKEIMVDFKLISLKEAGIEMEVEEDEETFEGNALKKAREIGKLTNKIVIADDSGLCIEALEGFPGVRTARFLGENASQKERNEFLLKKLEGLPREKRKAEVITCIAICYPNGEEKVVKGILKGWIANEKRGINGFGFDEIFELDNKKTLAQIDQEEKNQLSSRKKAILEMKKILTK